MVKPSPTKYSILITFLLLSFVIATSYYSVNTIEKTYVKFSSVPQVQLAQTNYDFTLINETVHVYVLRNGGIFINYSIVFLNHGDPIDIIDVGFPNDYYDIDTVEAYWDDGNGFVEMTDIRDSTVIAIGVEVHIPSQYRVSSGQNGTLMIWGENPHMVYEDTEHDDYAGIEFSPTWYDPAYCRSVDNLDVHLHFPDGFFNGTAAFWHHEEYTDYYYTNDSLVYHWYKPSHDPMQFTFGISFPAVMVDTFYPSNGGTSDGGFPGSFFAILVFAAPLIIGAGLLCVICGTVASLGQRSGRLRKRYLPPAVAVESLGLRRGLTVVEAAILLEVPLNRVLVLIIFGLLKKNLITLIPGQTPRIGILQPEVITRPTQYNLKLWYYERMFLKSVNQDGTLSKRHLQVALKSSIKTVARKMEGFSRTQTREYYRRIMRQVEQEIATANTPQLQSQTFDKYAEWLLIDEDYKEKVRRMDNWYVPYWYYYHFYPVYIPGRRTRGRGVGRAIPTPRAAPGPTGLPSASVPSSSLSPVSIPELANNFITGVENTANDMVNGFTEMANNIAEVFLPTPKPTRSAFSGRSCACACACASCACACAGGGR